MPQTPKTVPGAVVVVIVGFSTACTISDLRQVGGFSPGSPVSFTSKTESHDITEILLKVALNTITLTL